MGLPNPPLRRGASSLPYFEGDIPTIGVTAMYEIECLCCERTARSDTSTEGWANFDHAPLCCARDTSLFEAILLGFGQVISLQPESSGSCRP